MLYSEDQHTNNCPECSGIKTCLKEHDRKIDTLFKKYDIVGTTLIDIRTDFVELAIKMENGFDKIDKSIKNIESDLQEVKVQVAKFGKYEWFLSTINTARDKLLLYVVILIFTLIGIGWVLKKVGIDNIISKIME